ncbi:MAG: Zn-dependent hydrolase [Cyanobacteria bacterium P01_A01_bin.135]
MTSMAVESTSASNPHTGLSINGPRLLQTLTEIAAIGALPDGGVQRLAFSPEEQAARQTVAAWMHEAGMRTVTDAAGNLIGRYPGRTPKAPALGIGSHLDTAFNASAYDGTYSLLAGLEVVRSLQEQDIQLDHPLEIIVFADEERTMIGSKAMAGRASQEAEHYYHPDYPPIEAGVEAIGGSWPVLASARRPPGSLAAFVELHMEPGPVLAAAQVPIGLVTGIVGQRRFLVTIEGQASHAGTTPMTMRQDALVAASRMVLAVSRIGQIRDDVITGDQVATVGTITVAPNVANTIPGQAQLTVDMRDMSNSSLDRLFALLEDEAGAIAAVTKTEITITPQLRNEPAPASTAVYNAIVQVCRDLDVVAEPLPSRASHDAQAMAHITDMGMIFVPSQKGAGHTEAEYALPEHCTMGANVLLHTLLRLDQHYRIDDEQQADSNQDNNAQDKTQSQTQDKTQGDSD